MAGGTYKRIGHKGADALVPGNTLESFEAAVETGVDMVELDVLRDREGRLVVAHDYHDSSRRKPMLLAEALDGFLQPPLDRVEIDCDLKLPGREAELAGALEGHGLLERASVSTMEISSLIKLRTLAPELRLGWTVPKTRRDWTQYRWALPVVLAGLAAIKRRLPKTIRSRAPELGVSAVWAYHRLVTAKLIDAAHEAGIELIAWTVDDPAEIRKLAELGVDGICSNDPRLFAAHPGQARGPDLAPHKAGRVAEELAQDAEPSASNGARAREPQQAAR
jgi:glycerophosphoryl diester phosphodiesterase